MNIGILWDIENVTPPSGTDYIRSVIDVVSKDGDLSYAMAFGDWTRANIKDIAPELATNNFELIHIPRSGKNSADMSLVAHGVELIFQYPHIGRFVLISGDADFRPLLMTQKKHGKETWVICDVKKVSEELLKMADCYLDYREVIKRMDAPEEDDSGETDGGNELDRQGAFELFKETIALMLKEKARPSSSAVKMRMQLLNDEFDEKKLGYRNWSQFLKDAKPEANVAFENGAFKFVAEPGSTVPRVFRELLSALPDREWVPFARIGQEINFKNSGYSKFMALALDAEKRGYVDTKNKDTIWSIRKK
jgi:hypothetical protein